MSNRPFLVRLLPVVMLTACAASAAVMAPLDEASRRPVALRFGMQVSPNPDENPINPPERFIGYHAALDYETFPEEKDSEVPVYAICPGEVISSGYAEGYGGLIVQRCTHKGEPVTVLYGHLDAAGLAPLKTILSTGERIGRLAPGDTFWSGWNRKHLHLGIHRGEEIDMRGYVQHPEELDDYIDPRHVLPLGTRGRVVSEFTVPKE